MAKEWQIGPSSSHACMLATLRSFWKNRKKQTQLLPPAFHFWLIQPVGFWT